MEKDDLDAKPPVKVKSGNVSRRSFLGQIGAGVAAATIPVAEVGTAEPVFAGIDAADQTAAAAGETRVQLRVNGQNHAVSVDPRTTLLDCLRERVSLTGTKKGCDHGQCGACTVHINGRRVNSCLTLAILHEEDEIVTIEGLGEPGRLHPMQSAFVEHDSYQCGYCTSGQIMSAVSLLDEPCGQSDAEVKELMSGNICRCGAYPNIVAAIQAVRQRNPSGRVRWRWGDASPPGGASARASRQECARGQQKLRPSLGNTGDTRES